MFTLHAKAQGKSLFGRDLIDGVDELSQEVLEKIRDGISQARRDFSDVWFHVVPVNADLAILALRDLPDDVEDEDAGASDYVAMSATDAEFVDAFYELAQRVSLT